jgi:hypothetical protein
MLFLRAASRRLPCLGLRILAATMAVAIQTAAQTPASNSTHSQPSQQEILQELAVTQRLLADEEFIAGDRDKAKIEYEEAAQTVERLTTDGGFLTDVDIQLQKDEIQYRKLLLEREESFWGLEFKARPVNPVGEFGQFEATYIRFKSIIDDVNALTDKLKAGDMSSYPLEDQQIQNERDQRVAELQQDISNVKLRDADVRRAMYRDRKAAIQARQTAIVANIDALQKQVTDRSAAMNATLTSALTEAVGLPPDAANVLTAAAKGDYSGVVAAAVQRYADAPDAATGLSGQLKELATTAQNAAQRYEEARRTLNDVQEKANQGAALLKAIQSNDRDKLVAIGAEAMGGLSPATRDQLLAGMSKIKDVEGALKLAGQGTSVRAQIATFIGSRPDLSAKIGSLVKAYLQPQSESFAWRYQQLLMAESTTAKSAAEHEAVFASLSRGWSRSFVHDVLNPQGGTVAIATSLGSTCANDLDCTDWLANYISQKGPTGPIFAITDAGNVTISVNGRIAARFSVEDLAKIASGRALEAATSAVQTDIDTLVTRTQAAGTAFTVELVRRLPDVDFDRDIEPLLKSLSDDRTTELVQNLSSPGAGAVSAPTTLDMAALALGREIATKTIFSSVSTQGAPSNIPTPPTAASGSDPNQALILNAMKASGPYGYAAAIAIQVFSAIAQNGVAIDQINAQAREDGELTVEMLHITEFESDMNRDEAIATLEQRIATTQAASASSRSDLYEQAMVDQGTLATALQAKIRRRLPLIFLLSEQLRERFDSLDHALGFWENDLSSGERFLERTLRTDPQVRRLGLDPDISLYDWFKRDVEGQRKDLDALLVHWEQIETVVTALCARLHCTANDPQMGQVEMTDLIALRKLVGPADWGAAAKSRSLLFMILPQSLPNVPAREGLRLVHVTGAVSDSGNNHVNPNIILRHSGLGYVAAGGGGYRETLETSGDLTPKFPVDDAGSSNLQLKLQHRWSPNPTLGSLEGYPLYGLYEVRFPPDFNFTTTDLVLRFYYQWPVNAALLTRRNLDINFSCTDSVGRQEVVASSDVRLLLGRDEKGQQTLGSLKACTRLEAIR